MGKITILSRSNKFFWLEVDKIPIKGLLFTDFNKAKDWVNQEYDKMRSWKGRLFPRSSENIQRRRDGNP